MAASAKIPDGSTPMPDVSTDHKAMNHKRSMSDVDVVRLNSNLRSAANTVNPEPAFSSSDSSLMRANQKPRILKEGRMVRFGRRKYGRSFMHNRHFVLEPTRISYYKRTPWEGQIPVKSLYLDSNCRVEDKGMQYHHGRAVFSLCVLSKRDPSHEITMASFYLHEAVDWREAIEQVIEQIAHPHLSGVIGINNPRVEVKESVFHDRTLPTEKGSKVLEIQDEPKFPIPQDRIDVMRSEEESEILHPTLSEPKKKHWRLFQCQNGLRIFEEIPDDFSSQDYIRAMKAVGVVDAKCEDIFSLIMGMDDTRNEWDSTFHSGTMVQEMDGHTAVFYHRLQLDSWGWLSWPRDLCYTRYWRRVEDGSYVILFQSQENVKCPPQPGCVRAHIQSGGFRITPLKPRPGSEGPRAKVEHQLQIDFQGWMVRYWTSYQQQCLFQMLNSVSGLREWFAQCEDAHLVPRIQKLKTELVPVKKEKKRTPTPDAPISSPYTASQGEEDESDDEDDGQAPSPEASGEHLSKETITSSLPAVDAGVIDPVDWSAFPSVVTYDDRDNVRNSWSIPDSNNFRVRSRKFHYDRSKVPAGESLMQLVSMDWFKGPKRMDHLAQRNGCAAQVAAEKGLFTLLFNLQVPGSTHYSMVLYFVAKRPIPPDSLLQRFIDGDDGFRNSRLKLIPSVPKGTWIVRQSVGSTPCMIGKAVDCNYFRGEKYLEVDVDIGSSAVATGVLGLVFGAVTSLVVDIAFLIQGNSFDELPEKLIGTVRISRLELSKAVSPYPEKDKTA